MRELKRKAVEYKGGKCIVCGYSGHLAALDFDHIEQKINKKHGIGEMISRLRAWEAIKKELDNCQLLCANCHRIKTYENRDHERNDNNTSPL